MTTEVLNSGLQTTKRVEQSENSEIFEKMEAVQTAIDPYLAELNQPVDVKYLDPKIANEVLEVVNKIRTHYGEEPITNKSVARRLHALLNKIALVVENHLFYTNEKNYTEETKIKEETVPEIQKWTRWGGNAHYASAFGSPLLMLIGAFIPNEQFKTAIQGIANSNVVGGIASGYGQMLESNKTPEEHKRALFVQLASTKRQAQEAFKSLPKEIQQAIGKLLDLEGQRLRQMGQRG